MTRMEAPLLHTPSRCRARGGLDAVLEEVVSAYGAGVSSLETAEQMSMDAGYPISDASQEVASIGAAAAVQGSTVGTDVR